MESYQKYGLGISIVSLMLLVLVLGVYFVNDISNKNTQTVITKASEISPNLLIISPKPGEVIEGKILFKAKFQTDKNINSLKGVFKVGEGITLPLSLKQSDGSNITAEGEFDPKGYSDGQHYIKVYIYDTSGGKVVSAADAQYPISISNP